MQPPKQSDESFQDVNRLIWEHLESRDWHHNPPRSLAISIVLEAAELLEHYQWSDRAVGDKEALAAELADILIYAFEFAQANDIDMVSAIKQKLAIAAEKYPAEKFKGQDSSGHREAWIEAKLRYRKEGL